MALLVSFGCGPVPEPTVLLSSESEGFLFLENVTPLVRFCESELVPFPSTVSVYRGDRGNGDSVSFAYIENRRRYSPLRFAVEHGVGIRLADVISTVDGCRSAGVAPSSEIVFNSNLRMADLAEECGVPIDIMDPDLFPRNVYVRNDQIVCEVLGSRDAEEVSRLLEDPDEHCVSREEFDAFSRANFEVGCEE